MNTASTSERTETAALPSELRGWNWGAFLLNWIWGLGNRCYFALLTFVPLFGLLVPFILGFKGNAWAWRSQTWPSTAAFRRAQRRWAQAGLLVWASVVSLGVVAFFVASEAMERSEAFVQAQTSITGDPQVMQALGAPLRIGAVRGSIKKNGGGAGDAEISFTVTGSTQSAKAYVSAHERAEQWTLEHLELVLDDGRHLVLTETTPSALSAAPSGLP